MNTQFKKGVLELIVLLAVSKKDMYGYELVKSVCEAVEVNEGTIYPLLKRLSNEHYFDTYLQESTDGPPRKYYTLTNTGREYMDEYKKEWLNFVDSVSKFIERNEEDE